VVVAFTYLLETAADAASQLADTPTGILLDSSINVESVATYYAYPQDPGGISRDLKHSSRSEPIWISRPAQRQHTLVTENGHWGAMGRVAPGNFTPRPSQIRT
jgi:hypothetical protein